MVGVANERGLGNWRVARSWERLYRTGRKAYYPSSLHQLMQLRTVFQPTLLTCCLSPNRAPHTQTETRPRLRRAPTEGEASGVSPGRGSWPQVAPDVREATRRNLTGNQKTSRTTPDRISSDHKHARTRIPRQLVRQTSL